VGQGDTVLQDRLNHASLLDAGLLSGARFNRYLHNDPASLASAWKATGNTLVVTDGVFSMDGDSPTCRRWLGGQGPWRLADGRCPWPRSAWAPTAAVSSSISAWQDDVPVLVGTLGKAFGTAGAFVAGSEELIEALIQFARPYIYTTSQPPALACATLKSLELLRRKPGGASTWQR
jgi:8-amino-7-oxononanoate synthase